MRTERTEIEERMQEVNGEKQKSLSVISVARYSDLQRLVNNRSGRSADVLRTEVDASRPFAEPQDVFAGAAKPSDYLSLHSADSSQRPVDREFIENIDSKPVNILYDFLKSLVERS